MSLRARDLATALRDVDPDAHICVVVHNPVGCCDDPHPHDIPDLQADVEAVETSRFEVVIRLGAMSA